MRLAASSLVSPRMRLFFGTRHLIFGAFGYSSSELSKHVRQTVPLSLHQQEDRVNPRQLIPSGLYVKGYWGGRLDGDLVRS